MNETRWWQYVQRLIGDDTAQHAASRAGFDKSAFTRWKKGAKADPEFVVKLARGYGANVLEALVEAEFITESEARLREVMPDRRRFIDELTDLELAEEQRRRAQNTVTMFFDEAPTAADVAAAAKSAPVGANRFLYAWGGPRTDEERRQEMIDNPGLYSVKHVKRRRRDELSVPLDTLAAHHGDKGVPDIPSEAENPQIHPEDDDYA